MTRDPTRPDDFPLDTPRRDEDARLLSLSRYVGLVGVGHAEFDDIARLAALACKMPLASISIIGADKLWHQAEFGFGFKRRIELRHSFSRFIVDHADLVVINDARAHPDFRDSPYVTGAPFFRFCAGVPLLSPEGQPIGTLCVFDSEPRDLGDEAALALKALARQCISQLELRRSLRIEREADERLRLIFESATDYAIMTLDPDGHVTSWNKGAQLIFGWSDEEATGRHVAMIFTPTDQENGVPSQDFQQAMLHGRQVVERYYQRKNRSQFWGTGETMPLLTSTGETRGFLKILRDRTTQKRIKEALEYQTGVLQAITDNLGEALFQVDIDHRVTFMNPAAEAMFGWSRYELLGVNLHDRLHLHPGDGAEADDDCPYVVALKSRAIVPQRSDVFVHRDGRHVDVVVSFTPIVSEGTVTGAVMTVNDVTETRKIEEALKRTQERYQLAVSSSEIIGSWDWDLRARTVVADATFAAQYGVDPKTAQEGAPLEAFAAAIHPDDRERVFAEIDESIATRRLFTGEYRLLRPDGTILWVSAYARCQFDGRGRPVRFPGLSVDITKRKGDEERRDGVLELEDRLRNEEDSATISGLAADMLGRLLGAYRAGFCALDATGQYGTIERDYVRDGAQSLAGTYKTSDYGAYGEAIRSGTLISIADIEADERMASERPRWRSLGVRSIVNAPLMAEGRVAAVFFVHSDTPREWTADDVALIQNVSDRTWAAISRGHSAALQRMLTGELHHRIKNTLTIVQAIARQTMRKAATKEDALAAFDARVLALGAAQDVLTHSNWSAATMHQIVDGALRPHRHGQSERIDVTGAEVSVSPQTALSFVLALHELATNATKYGALSNDSGRVSIQWAVADRYGEMVFTCVWQENGGPPVVPPTEKGFGSRLIKAGFTRAFKVEIDYAPAGLRATFEALANAL